MEPLGEMLPPEWEAGVWGFGASGALIQVCHPKP